MQHAGHPLYRRRLLELRILVGAFFFAGSLIGSLRDVVVLGSGGILRTILSAGLRFVRCRALGRAQGSKRNDQKSDQQKLRHRPPPAGAAANGRSTMRMTSAAKASASCCRRAWASAWSFSRSALVCFTSAWARFLASARAASRISISFWRRASCVLKMARRASLILCSYSLALASALEISVCALAMAP